MRQSAMNRWRPSRTSVPGLEPDGNIFFFREMREPSNGEKGRAFGQIRVFHRAKISWFYKPVEARISCEETERRLFC